MNVWDRLDLLLPKPAEDNEVKPERLDIEIQAGVWVMIVERWRNQTRISGRIASPPQGVGLVLRRVDSSVVLVEFVDGTMTLEEWYLCAVKAPIPPTTLEQAGIFYGRTISGEIVGTSSDGKIGIYSKYQRRAALLDPSEVTVKR